MDNNTTIKATGRRKTSVAQVRLTQDGEGKIMINGKTPEQYFGNIPRLAYIVNAPFLLTKDQKFDCTAKVEGGGPASQAGAVRHGIARAIAKLGDDFHSAMKKAGFLTRDPRMVERKKPGQPKARRRFQFSKR